MAVFALKSAEFRREREASWRELDALISVAESEGIRALGRRELQRLPTLYRGVVGSLSVALAISLDRNVLDYLTSLSQRAYVLVYANKRPAGEVFLEFLSRTLPRTVRWLGWALLISVACLAAGTLSGYVLTRQDPERYYSLVPMEAAQGRDPSSSTQLLREVLYSKGKDRMDSLNLFASFLFSRNAKIGMLGFALGFVAGIPVIFLLFYNGILLGAMAALYDSRGLSREFWAWILPHGLTELMSVCLCGAAGLELGMALLFPGRRTRLEEISMRGRRAALIIPGAVGMFFLAALIEGIFRQRVHDVGVRYTVAGVSLVLWACYFGLAGQGRHHAR